MGVIGAGRGGRRGIPLPAGPGPAAKALSCPVSACRLATASCKPIDPKALGSPPAARHKMWWQRKAKLPLGTGAVNRWTQAGPAEKIQAHQAPGKHSQNVLKPPAIAFGGPRSGSGPGPPTLVQRGLRAYLVSHSATISRPPGPGQSMRRRPATICLRAAAAGGALARRGLGSPAGAPGTEPAAGRARAALDSAAELALPRAAHAAVPAEVDGQPLPSLADMR